MTPTGRSLALASAACVVISAACGRAAPEEIVTKTVVPVTIEAARVGAIRAVIHATGIVEPAPGASLIVTAPEAARIAEIPKAEGDRVRRGDLLVRFEIPSLNAAAAGKSAEVSRAEAGLQNARASQARAHDLFDRGVAARKEVEDADRALSDAEAALDEARAGRSASEMLSDRATVRATFDGIVAQRSHDPGDLVEASASDPVMRVIDPRRLEIDASVPISDISRIVEGASARLIVSAGSRPEALKVVSRPAAVEAGTASVPVRLAFVAPTNLAAGTPVQVEIDGEESANVVLVPAAAVVHEGDQIFVFVAAGGKAQRRAIVIGLTDAERAEVRSGLKAGEVVITHGQSGLPDGAAVSTAPAEK